MESLFTFTEKKVAVLVGCRQSVWPSFYLFLTSLPPTSSLMFNLEVMTGPVVLILKAQDIRK